MKKCPVCGALSNDADVFCGNCGHDYNQSSIEVVGRKEGAKQVCSVCNLSQSNTNLFCEACGSKLDKQADKKKTTESISSVNLNDDLEEALLEVRSSVKTCPNCGSVQSAEHLFCEACGYSLKNESKKMTDQVTAANETDKGNQRTKVVEEKSSETELATQTETNEVAALAEDRMIADARETLTEETPVEEKKEALEGEISTEETPVEEKKEALEGETSTEETPVDEKKEALEGETSTEETDGASRVEDGLANSRDLQTCPNCGQQQAIANAFCEYCGQKMLVAGSPASFQSVPPVMEQPVREPQSSQTVMKKEPMSTKKKVVLALLVIIIIALIGAYMLGKSYYSEEQQVDRFITMLKQKDAKQLASLLRSDDPNYKITAKNLQPYLDYYQDKENQENFSDLISDLKIGRSENADIHIRKEGRKFGLFDQYNFYLKPVYLTLKTNQKGLTFFLENKNIGQSTSNKYQQKVGPLTPGKYQIEGKLPGEKEKSKQIVSLVRYRNKDFETAREIEMNFTKLSFKIESNSDIGEVQLDGNKIGDLKAGQFVVKNIIWHEGMTLQIVRRLADKAELKSEKVELSENNYLAADYDPELSTIQLDIENEVSKADVQDMLDDLYYNFDNYTSSSYDYGAKSMTDLSDHFVGGENNDDFKDFDTFIRSIRSSDVKSYVAAEASVENVQLIGKNTYKVQYLIEYKTVYKDFDTDSIIQVFRYKKATIVNDEASKSLKIRDLGGKENFEVVDNGGV